MTEVRASSPMRLSVPPRVRTVPRPLTEAERSGLLRAADVLIPGTDRDPAPTSVAEYEETLLRSLAARRDAFETLAAVGATMAPLDDAGIDAELRRLHAEDGDTFQALSAVLAGAYFQLPSVLERLRYPGQKRNPPRLEEAIEQLETGILDPVIARGPIYVPAGED